MGFFSDLIDGITGRGGREAAQDAAQLQSDAALAGIESVERQFNQTREDLSPFLAAGRDLLPEAVSGASIGGFGERLGQIFNSDFFDPLVQERLRTVRGEVARSGLRRSGAGLEALADVPTELALALENQLFGRTQNLVGSGQNAGARLGAFGANAGSQAAQLLGNQGDALAQGQMNAAQSVAGGAQNLLGLGRLAFSPMPDFGGTVLGSILGSFSDRRLKKNARVVGRVIDLDVHEWEWIDEAPDFVKEQPTKGFMADEVLAKYPDAVNEFAGFLTVDYEKVA